MLFLGLLFYVPYNIFMILRGEQGSVFHKFQPMRLDSASEEFKRKLWMEVALLLLDVLLQFNTVPHLQNRSFQSERNHLKCQTQQG